ncbi:DUF2799 domain-containing protein [Labrenzia suaedae]|uniref:DUF2799 domain-containing protein n=2 Tax=Roseibium litorale TaxID=2803841 RepID=A0ABR9CMM5_9HYPH|nr:DUF2799 domain-containing protein [Roseibium litorale]
MKLIMGGIAALFAVLLLAGCETVSKEQCAAGDWVALGKADGANGYQASRLADIVKDCGRYGVTPDTDQYMSGWNQGVQIYCTPMNGYNAGRQGKSASPVCPPQMAGSFEYAHSLGKRIWQARSKVEEQERRVRDIDNRMSRLRLDVGSLSCSGKNGDELRACREDVHRRRQDLQDARFDLQDARWRLMEAQRFYDETERTVSAEAARTIPGYGPQ